MTFLERFQHIDTINCISTDEVDTVLVILDKNNCKLINGSTWEDIYHHFKEDLYRYAIELGGCVIFLHRGQYGSKLHTKKDLKELSASTFIRLCQIDQNFSSEIESILNLI